MNRKTFWELVLSVFCLILLLGLSIYLLLDLMHSHDSGLLASESPFVVVETEHTGQDTGNAGGSLQDGQNTAVISQGRGNTADKQTAAALEALQAAQMQLPRHQFIFVGDSRTVGMGDAETDAGDTCRYIGAVGEGYSWFADTGLALMEEAMDACPDAPVILNLGVNDLDRIDQYLELYRTFKDSYPNRDFYYLSVNPVTEQSAHVTNMEIAGFNTRLREEFPDQYLDSNTYLRVQEFESADGVHYSDDTYRMIHDYVARQIAG